MSRDASLVPSPTVSFRTERIPPIVHIGMFLVCVSACVCIICVVFRATPGRVLLVKDPMFSATTAELS